MDTSLLRYPNKSHRKSINIPLNSIDLAEFMEIVFGDGGINNPWQVAISMNSISDLEYASYVVRLIENLFGIKVIFRKRPYQNRLLIVCSNTNLVDFLVDKGAIKGNKIIQGINIPSWIKGDSEFSKRFVRGLVDIDGCLYCHKHKVKGKQLLNIGFCFTSYSEKLLLSVAEILSNFGIKPHVTDNNRRIYLYGESNVVEYLNIFGSSNPRIYQKYISWRDARAV